MKVPKLDGRRGGATITRQRRRLPAAGRPLPALPSALEQAFATLWAKLTPTGGMPAPDREFAFHEGRKWRFDFAWPKRMVAVELEGLVRGKGGRHQRVEGFALDCEKYNAAVMAGWAVLRYTSADLAQRPVQVVEEVQRLLLARK
jgi:hypothetical protein